jgi:hypothetical protein
MEQAKTEAEKNNLSFRTTNPPIGSNFIVIEETFEYSPFSCIIRFFDGRSPIRSNTTQKYKELCKELGKNK